MCSIMHIDKLATKALGISSIATFSLLCCDVIEEMSIDSARARAHASTGTYEFCRECSFGEHPKDLRCGRETTKAHWVSSK